MPYRVLPLLLLCFFGPALTLAQSEREDELVAKFLRRLDQCNAVVSAVDVINIQRELTVKGERYANYEVGIAGDESFFVEKNVGSEMVYLKNPRYYATVSRVSDNAPWELAHLEDVSGARGELNDLFHEQILDPCSVYSFLKHCHSSVQKIGQSQLELVIPESVDSPLVLPYWLGATVRIEVENSGVLKSIEAFTKAGEGVRMRYSDYEQVNAELSLPRVVEWDKIEGFGGPATGGFQVMTRDYSSFSKPFDNKRCYLLYYGIPEPDSGFRWKWAHLFWAVFGVGLLLVVVMFTKHQKSQNH